MKKILSILMILFVSVLSFSSCSSNTSGDKSDTEQTETDTDKDTSSIKEIKVGVALYKFDDTFISTVRKNMDEYAKTIKDVNIKLNFVDGQGQQINQNDQIDTFITQKYDVLAINMVDRTAASVVIEKAKAANIPVVFFNREPVESDMALWEEVVYVGAKAEESGTIQGQAVAELFKSNPELIDKNNDGKLQYVLLEGEPGHQDAILRTEYSIKALSESGVEVDKLAQDTANWQVSQGQEKMAAWLSAYGDSVEAVFANNDDMALGAIEALKTAGYFTDDKKIVVVGVDATAPALDSLEKGYMYATVLNDTVNQAKAIVDSTVAMFNDRNINSLGSKVTDKQYIWVPYQAVTQDNLKDFK